MTTTIPYYHAIGKEEEIFSHAYSNKIPLLLKGPTGTGNTTGVGQDSGVLIDRVD